MLKFGERSRACSTFKTRNELAGRDTKSVLKKSRATQALCVWGAGFLSERLKTLWTTSGQRQEPRHHSKTQRGLPRHNTGCPELPSGIAPWTFD